MISCRDSGFTFQFVVVLVRGYNIHTNILHFPLKRSLTFLVPELMWQLTGTFDVDPRIQNGMALACLHFGEGGGGLTHG